MKVQDLRDRELIIQMENKSYWNCLFLALISIIYILNTSQCDFYYHDVSEAIDFQKGKHG